MANKNLNISIIIPTLNEEKNLDVLLSRITNNKRLSASIKEIIVVDGYSKDKTVQVARKHSGKVLFDSKGKGSALRKGMRVAKGEIIIMMDADLSNREKEILLLAECIKLGYDAAFGSRFIQGGGSEDMPVLRRLGNKFFVLLVNLFWGSNYSDLCYGYRAFSQSAIKKLSLVSDGFPIETEISIKSAKKKLKVVEVPSFEKQRVHGKGKLKTFRDGIRIFSWLIREIMHP